MASPMKLWLAFAVSQIISKCWQFHGISMLLIIEMRVDGISARDFILHASLPHLTRSPFEGNIPRASVTCKDSKRKCAGASARDERKGSAASQNGTRAGEWEGENGREGSENVGEQTRVRRCERAEER